LLDDLREGRGYSDLKEEASNRTVWRNRFGGGIGDLSLDRLMDELMIQKNTSGCIRIKLYNRMIQNENFTNRM
jgi:anti-sigma regulatory factor (Ser/Thr protein kinase)